MEGSYALITSLIPAYPTMDLRLATVVSKTASYTVVTADLDKPTIFNNTGASGNVALTLPTAASGKGKVVRAYASAAQTLQFVPQTGEKVNYCGDAVASKYAQLAGVIGNYMEAFSDGTQWIITRANGVVTKEA